jgi:hypothetical protein
MLKSTKKKEERKKIRGKHASSPACKPLNAMNRIRAANAKNSCSSRRTPPEDDPRVQIRQEWEKKIK